MENFFKNAKKILSILLLSVVFCLKLYVTKLVFEKNFIIKIFELFTFFEKKIPY